MTKNKLAYEAPKTESQELRFEGIVCTSPGQNQSVGESQNYGGINGWV